MILICYDGSEDAKAAIERAGSLFHGDPAVVVTVWEPFSEMLARTSAGLGFVTGVPDDQRFDEEGRKSAEQMAEEGSALARGAGLDPSTRVCPRAGTVAHTILGAADRANASAIVLGSRGLTGVGSLFLGSVSHAVVQSADRAVLVVPSPKVAAKRNEKLRAED
jgi:nucleotide-binding universal stress UspA family protein